MLSNGYEIYEIGTFDNLWWKLAKSYNRICKFIQSVTWFDSASKRISFKTFSTKQIYRTSYFESVDHELACEVSGLEPMGCVILGAAWGRSQSEETSINPWAEDDC